MSNYLFISDAAKEVKVESHVLRYWEEELHLPIKRNELGHRYYTEEDVQRFKQIKGMKERGLQLKAIKMILKDGKLDVLPDTSADSAVPSASELYMEDDGAVKDGETDKITGSADNEPKERPESSDMPKGLAIDIVPGKNRGSEVESREDKSRRLQWLLQQLIRQTLQENNGQLCQEIRESVVKELDYQFRMQEEREEARDKMLAQRDEEHYKRMDEIIRRKSRFNKKLKQEKKQEKKRLEKMEKMEKKLQKETKRENADSAQMVGSGQAAAATKKKRRFM